MTNAEKIQMVKAMCDETDDSTISAYLYMAGKKIISRAYPYDRSVSEVPEQYEHLQIDGAVYLLNKRGAEGETAHNENGISRTYQNADLPDSMLNEIAPMCGVAR